MKSISLYKFFKKKYGVELLIDVVDIDYIREAIQKTPVHRYNFYCIVLITNGSEDVAIDGHTCRVKPGTVICSTPGEIWSWQDNCRLDGYLLIFEEEFLISFFNDPLFLQRFSYLSTKRISPFLIPQNELSERISHLFIQMKTEISDYKEKDQHVLRAMLYETLMLLNRADSVEQISQPANDTITNRYIDPFIRMVNSEYMSERNTQYYADKLCITANYLNKIVRRSLGTTAKLYILDKVMLEAKRLLSYSPLSIAEIADVLHFNTASYFIRFFRKQTGLTPVQYREQTKS